MLTINENGDLVREGWERSIPHGEPVSTKTTLATAAELKATLAEAGLAIVPVADAIRAVDAMTNDVETFTSVGMRDEARKSAESAEHIRASVGADGFAVAPPKLHYTFPETVAIRIRDLQIARLKELLRGFVNAGTNLDNLEAIEAELAALKEAE